jgi:hypothetical protein
MHRKINPRLSYANVVATLALFLVLAGGSALAATGLAKNSVGSRQLKSKAVTTGKIAPNAINGSKVKNGSLGGEDIDLARLGTVPSAASATSAGNADTLGGHAAACPSGTTLIHGLCFDSHSNPAAQGVEEAADACAAKGGFLPTPMQLYVTRGILNLGNNVGADQHQFTDSLYGDPGSGHLDKTVVLDGVGPPEEYDAAGESAYYCAYQLVR